MIITLSQQRLLWAHDRVSEQLQEPKAAQRAYGQLCHRFPAMVLQGGLVSAVSFLESKADGGGDEAKVYTRIISDLCDALSLPGGVQLASRLRRRETLTLMADTREVLDRWSYMKRLARSVLKVEASDDTPLTTQEAEG